MNKNQGPESSPTSDEERFRQITYDYFFGDGSNDLGDYRQWYVANNIAYTNNLYLYIQVSSMPDNPRSMLAAAYDYTKREDLRGVFETFRENNPDLWQQAVEVAQESSERSQRYLASIGEGAPGSETLEAEAEESQHRLARTMHDAYMQLAPALEEAGIDPIEICI